MGFSFYTGMKHQHDPDDDSDIGLSPFTGLKDTTLSDVSYYNPPDYMLQYCMATPSYAPSLFCTEVFWFRRAKQFG